MYVVKKLRERVYTFGGILYEILWADDRKLMYDISFKIFYWDFGHNMSPYSS